MKSVGDILLELGFNKNAPLETQKAFLKHLVSAANQSTNVKAAEPQVEKPKHKVGEQLEFDFSENKRVS